MHMLGLPRKRYAHSNLKASVTDMCTQEERAFLICPKANMGCTPGQDPAGMVPCRRPLSVDWIFISPGICPQSPNDVFMGSTTTFAAVVMPLDNTKFPPTVAGILPARQLSFRIKASMTDDKADPWLSHVRGIDPAQCLGKHLCTSALRRNTLHCITTV